MGTFRVVYSLLFVAVLGAVEGQYDAQLLDAVLFIDGTPTYLRLTNSTSLENIYNCVIDTSKTINTVIMTAQMKAVQLDVGQVEQNARDIIRRLALSANRNGHPLWKNPEELQMFKNRLARYLTLNYYDSRPTFDQDTYLNYKTQRSADGQFSARPFRSNYRVPMSRWSESSVLPTKELGSSTPGMALSTVATETPSTHKQPVMVTNERTSVPTTSFSKNSLSTSEKTTEGPPKTTTHLPVTRETPSFSPRIEGLIFEKSSPAPLKNVHDYQEDSFPASEELKMSLNLGQAEEQKNWTERKLEPAPPKLEPKMLFPDNTTSQTRTVPVSSTTSVKPKPSSADEYARIKEEERTTDGNIRVEEFLTVNDEAVTEAEAENPETVTVPERREEDGEEPERAYDSSDLFKLESDPEQTKMQISGELLNRGEDSQHGRGFGRSSEEDEEDRGRKRRRRKGRRRSQRRRNNRMRPMRKRLEEEDIE